MTEGLKEIFTILERRPRPWAGSRGGLLPFRMELRTTNSQPWVSLVFLLNLNIANAIYILFFFVIWYRRWNSSSAYG